VNGYYFVTLDFSVSLLKRSSRIPTYLKLWYWIFQRDKRLRFIGYL